MDRIRLKHLPWGVIIGVVFVGLIATMVYLFAVTSPSQAWHFFPQSGSYSLEHSERSLIAPPEDAEATGSLDFTINGKRLNRVTFENLNLGTGSGLTNVFEFSGTGGNSIYVDVFTADGLVCRTFKFANMQVHTAVYKDNEADGNTFAFASGDPNDISIQSTRGGSTLSVTNDTYDKIKMTVTSADANISSLLIKNVKTFGGDCLFSDLYIGRLDVINSYIGAGDGFGPKDFGFGTGVTIGTFTGDNNTEVLIDIR